MPHKLENSHQLSHSAWDPSMSSPVARSGIDIGEKRAENQTVTKPSGRELLYRDSLSVSTSPLSPEAALKEQLDLAIKEAEKSSLTIKETVTDAVSWLWGWIWGKNSTTPTTGKPTIQPPDQIDDRTRQTFLKEMVEMQAKIKELDDEYQQLLKDNPNGKGEAALLKLLSLLLRNQLKLKERQGENSVTKISSNQNNVEQIRKESEKIKREQDEISQKVETISKVSALIGAGATIAALATLTVTTGGAAGAIAPISAKFLEGITIKVSVGLGIGRGFTTFLRGIVDGKFEEKQKESYLLKAKEELAKDGVKVGLDELKRAVTDIGNIWGLLKEVAEKQRQASLAIIKR